MSEWISMRDEKPDKFSWFLVYGPLLGIEIAHYNDNSGEFYCRTYNITEYVTHWAELPDKPPNGYKESAVCPVCGRRIVK